MGTGIETSSHIYGLFQVMNSNDTHFSKTLISTNQMTGDLVFTSNYESFFSIWIKRKYRKKRNEWASSEVWIRIPIQTQTPAGEMGKEIKKTKQRKNDLQSFFIKRLILTFFFHSAHLRLLRACDGRRVCCQMFRKWKHWSLLLRSLVLRNIRILGNYFL